MSEVCDFETSSTLAKLCPLAYNTKVCEGCEGCEGSAIFFFPDENEFVSERFGTTTSEEIMRRSWTSATKNLDSKENEPVHNACWRFKQLNDRYLNY